MTFDEWSRLHPAAAQDLLGVIGARQPAGSARVAADASEARVQQQVRFSVAQHVVQGPAGPVRALSWRNNVGATPARTEHSCPRCHFQFWQKQQPVRYGLANDSAQLNAAIKSGDLILAIPRLIQPQDVGRVIAQFGSIETKPAGWHYTGSKQEPGQAAWAALLHSVGAYATFSTGEVRL